MNTLLDAIGPAVWRASWQAALLALLVMLVVLALGDRLSPRWRYLLWSVVMIRLLLVATPGSPWSAFNLVRVITEANARRLAVIETAPKVVPDASAAGRGAQPAAGQVRIGIQPPRDAGSMAKPASSVYPTQVTSSPAASTLSRERAPTTAQPHRVVPVARILSSVWLAGCLFSGLQLAGRGRLVPAPKRLSACRVVTDAAVLAVLETACQQIGLRTRPALLVTPESISPCILGCWNQSIIVPESFVTESTSTRLRHVLAHELAHVVRRDLWTNWLLLVTRTVHWFNPVAWWTIRQMHAEREAACDELALAALGETDRKAYASTIIDLATNLAPPGMAPAMIGVISSIRRLANRIERLERVASLKSLPAPFAGLIVLALAVTGLTDAQPAVASRPSQAKAAPNSQTLPASSPRPAPSPFAEAVSIDRTRRRSQE